jgi:hypothetical protein
MQLVVALSSEIAFKVQNFFFFGGGGGKQIKRESIVTGTETIFLPNTDSRLTPNAARVAIVRSKLQLFLHCTDGALVQSSVTLAIVLEVGCCRHRHHHHHHQILFYYSPLSLCATW